MHVEGGKIDLLLKETFDAGSAQPWDIDLLETNSTTVTTIDGIKKFGLATSGTVIYPILYVRFQPSMVR